MSDLLLQLRKLSVAVSGKPIFRELDLVINVGEIHVLLGANGSGKSSILAAIMGLAPFETTSGQVLYRGSDIGDLSTDERACLGIGLAFQRPPELAGVTLSAFADALDAGETLDREAAALDLTGFAERDLMVGFSGGEIKRWEILKLFLQAPDLLLLDEPESGVDLAHIAAIGAAINRLTAPPTGERRAALLITHSGLILEHVEADVAHVLVDGRIVHSGEPRTVFRHIQQAGYSAPTG